MFWPFKFLFYFTLSFILLSFPYQQKALFFHIYSRTAPYTYKLYGEVNQKVRSGWNRSLRAGKKLFHNSEPQADIIKTQSSSHLRDMKSDEFTSEERDFIEKIIHKEEKGAR